MKRTLLMTALLSLLAGGCVIVDDRTPQGPAGALVGDLEVVWTLSGGQAGSLCDYYGIGSFIVEARGPEARDVSVDCRSAWTTGSALHLIAEGGYTITLRVIDPAGVQISARSTSVGVVSNGLVTEVGFALTPADL